MIKRKRTKKHEATRILQNVSEDKAFWVSNGAVLRNLHDLAQVLETINHENYNHHVNYEKNDFSNWLRDVVRDEILAKEIIHARNKESATKKVKERIELLKGMLPNA
ncbi:hypothetical protein HYX18_04230 [Candidatus Woesearchaeota archaeon]|nr:hypothetical protein [Candidatus Woesearchaeota archaeon]